MAKKLTDIDYIKLYKEVFGTTQGKMVLIDICERARVLKPFPLKERQELDLSFCEGQRQLALDILLKVNYDLNKLIEQRELNKIEVQYDR